MVTETDSNGSKGASGSSRKRPPEKDFVSRKQLCNTVVGGRKVTMEVFDVGSITGYVCGMDSYHWMIVDPDGRKYLIHKSAAGMIELHDEQTYRDEPNRESLDGVVMPFRDFVVNERNSSRR